MSEQTMGDDVRTEFDVVILGAGAAGLTLAAGLSKERPGTSILLVEKSSRAPEAAHKVGESTVDIGAHYLRDILGLEEHLTTGELDKFGLRFFFTHGENRDITHRVELGHRQRPDVGATYQIDRGRFENYLIDDLTGRGIEVWMSHRVDQVDLGEAPGEHTVTVTAPDGNIHTIRATWVIDASGRAALLKRKLGLAKPNGHNVNAVWFRIGFPINIDTFSTSPTWHEKIAGGSRRLSTNH